jgi:hypothetical protein
VESWFLRANHPDRPLAFWLKITILAPLDGPAVVETWFVGFDGERKTHYGHRDTHPLGETALGATLSAGSYRFDFDGGALSGTCGEAAFDLRMERAEGAVARPLSIFPFAWMITAPFPKSKLLSPFPWARFSGSVRWPGAEWAVESWDGMEGHNWGKEHALEYAWGQCLFPGPEPTMVEGFTGRVKIGPVVTPRLSAMVVRRGEREYRFDRLFDAWAQEATITDDRWTLRLRSADGEARLRMNAAGRPMACLGYRNPDGRLSYCFNSKLADTLLEVQPRDGVPFHCASPHGGALEFLRSKVDPSLPVV